MKMVKSVYKKILDNVPTHMPETGGMLGGQDGTVTKVVYGWLECCNYFT